MTVLELKKKCDELIEKGYSESTVLVDVEARTFNVHLVEAYGIHVDSFVDPKIAVINIDLQKTEFNYKQK